MQTTIEDFARALAVLHKNGGEIKNVDKVSELAQLPHAARRFVVTKGSACLRIAGSEIELKFEYIAGVVTFHICARPFFVSATMIAQYITDILAHKK